MSKFSEYTTSELGQSRILITFARLSRLSSMSLDSDNLFLRSTRDLTRLRDDSIIDLKTMLKTSLLRSIVILKRLTSI